LKTFDQERSTLRRTLNKEGAVFGPKLVLTHGPSVLAYIVFAIVLAAAAIVVKRMVAHVLKRLLRLLSGRKAGELRTVTSVVRRQILTANETALFRSLQAAVGEQYLIFPQLSLKVFLKDMRRVPPPRFHLPIRLIATEWIWCWSTRKICGFTWRSR